MEIDLTSHQDKLLKKCNKKPILYNKEYEPLVRIGLVCYTQYESDDIGNWKPASNEIETTALGKEYLSKLKDKKWKSFKSTLIGFILGIISAAITAIIVA